MIDALSKILLLTTIHLFIICHVNAQNTIRISSDFPGGNIVVNKISKDTVWLAPDLSFTEGNWFYWYFKVSNISGKRVTFKFNQNNLIAKFGPTYSINNDQTWKWLNEYQVEDSSFSFSFSKQDTIAFFSIAFPYTEKNLYTFLSNLNNKKLLKVDTLCLSPENRIIEKITITPTINKSTSKVIITARHHACEMMANYVVEGIIESLLNDKNLEYLREHVEFLFIPFMDKDGVENGEQGKNRIPRDHNRDYVNEPIHKSTATLRTIVPEWSEGKLEMAIDVHCPALKGNGHEFIYLVGASDSTIENRQIQFSKLLEKNSLGDIKAYHKNFLSFGVGWNTTSNYSKGMSFSRWAGMIDDISLAATLEFPYSNVSGIPVSKDGARIFGKTIAYSIKEYLISIE